MVFETLVLLAVGLGVVRVFVAEAYVVPSGSMAPALLGIHRDLICPRCRTAFSLGADEDEWEPGRPVCPNCGNREFEAGGPALCDGDHVLVQKQVFDFRPPRRWEVAAFASRESAGKPFVKRVVGLPGEEIEIRAGDLYVDGRIARKDLAAVRALRVLVYDHDHRPADYEFAPRWVYLTGPDARERRSSWQPVADGFEATALEDRPDTVDWLVYRHWQPDRQAPGPIRDFLAYDGDGSGGDYRVDDLMLACDVALPVGPRGIRIALSRGEDHLEVRLAAGEAAIAEVRLNGSLLEIRPREGKIAPSRDGSPRFCRVEASFFDRRLIVAIDEKLAFDPVDLPVVDTSPPGQSELAIGLDGQAARLRHLQVYRDLYYTPQLAGGFRPAFGVGRSYQLGPDEYFVLGDNSVVSHDSRFWSNGPVVRRSEFVGKPFLVHWPGRMTPLFLFGRGPYWVPDLGEIRYIR
jgi:signal peptidase I